jgi:hypothetical protein
MDERKEFEVWWYEHGLGPMDAQRDAWQASAEQSRAECEALRLELDLCGQLKRGYQDQAALAAEECEALRKDAERLNWLEQGGQWELTRLRASAKPDAMRYWMVEDFDGDDLTQETDEAERQTLRGAIDAAMGKEKA